MNAYLSRKNHDHHSEQRKIAIGALAGKIDQHDGRADSVHAATYQAIALVVLMLLAALWAVTS